MKQVGDLLSVSLVVGSDLKLHATLDTPKTGDVFHAACGFPRALRTPTEQSGKIVEKMCPICIQDAGGS